MKSVSYIPVLFILLLISPLYGEDCKKASSYFQEGFKLEEDLPNSLKKEQFYKKAVELWAK